MKFLVDNALSPTLAALLRALVANLPQVSDALEAGAIVTFEPTRVRVRSLPISRS